MNSDNLLENMENSDKEMEYELMSNYYNTGEIKLS